MKFEDAKKRMVKYLTSEEFKTREDAENTQDSVPILIKIIQHGFITDNSQEGSISNGYNLDTKMYYHIEERAYVTGFMKQEKARAFVEWINSYTDKVALIIHSEPSKEFETLFYEGDVKAIPSIPVTIQGSSKTKGAITALHPFSKLSTILPTKIVDFERKQVHINKSERVEYVQVFDPKYGRKATSKQGLYADILKGLEAK